MLIIMCAAIISAAIIDAESSLVVAMIMFAFSLYFLPKSITNIHATHVLIALLLVTALPLLIAYYGGAPIIAMSNIRIHFHREEWIATALAVVLFQSAMLIACTTPGRSYTAMASLLLLGKRRSTLFISLCVAGMVLFSVLSNQTETIFHGTYGTHQFYSDKGWFSGWPLLFVVASALFFYATRMERRRDYVVMYVVIAYWLFYGNRSEVFIQALLPILIYISRGTYTRSAINSDASNLRKWLLVRRLISGSIAVLLIVTMFQGLGFFRESGTVQGAIDTGHSVAQSRGLAISTIGPSSYTLVAAVGLTHDSSYGYKYGRTYLDYLYRILPSKLNLFDKKEDIADLFIAEANAIGGAHFGAEAYLNGGLVGSVIFAAIVAILLNRLSLSAVNDDLSLVFLLSLIFYFPRFVFYGNIYVYKLVLLFGVLYASRYLWRTYKRSYS